MSGKSKKWKLWRSSWKGFKHRNGGVGSEGSDSSSVNNDAYTAAVATVVRASPKSLKAVMEEWAAIRIQTAFRGFLVFTLILLSSFLLSCSILCLRLV